MKIDGRCHCGSITFEAEINLNDVLICHCTDCQTLSSTAFRTVVFTPEDSFSLRSRSLKTYVKIPDSGKERAQTFCPDCGTPIYSAAVNETRRLLGLRVGAIKQRAELVPIKQYWCGSAQPWVTGVESLDTLQTQEDWV
jgi:hypothetical protein